MVSVAMRGACDGPAMEQRTKATPPRSLLTIADVADRLAVSERHVRRLVFERRIPFLKWGHLLRFDAADVEAWIEFANVTEHPGA